MWASICSEPLGPTRSGTRKQRSRDQSLRPLSVSGWVVVSPGSRVPTR